MTKDNQEELMMNVHGLFVSAVHLTARMLILESFVQAIAAQQREILVRLGGDSKLIEIAFEKARRDAFSRLSQEAATQINATAAQERQRRRKKK